MVFMKNLSEASCLLFRAKRLFFDVKIVKNRGGARQMLVSEAVSMKI